MQIQMFPFFYEARTVNSLSSAPGASCSLTGTTIYLFYAQGEKETDVAAWLAPLQVVRPDRVGSTSLFPVEGARRPPPATHPSAPAELNLLASPPPPPPPQQPGMRLVPQLQEPDLGARMGHAMQHAFAQGHRRVAIVGTDVPDLAASTVGRALQELDAHQARAEPAAVRRQAVAAGFSADMPLRLPLSVELFGVVLTERCALGHSPSALPQAVFGPAEDGGYYLLALTALPAGLFHVRSPLLVCTSPRSGPVAVDQSLHLPDGCPPNLLPSLKACPACPSCSPQGIEWSTPTVLAANAANARRLGLHVAPLDTLERLQDIDTVEDLRCWCARQQRPQLQQVVQTGSGNPRAADVQQGQAGQQPGSRQALLEAAFQIIARVEVPDPFVLLSS